MRLAHAGGHAIFYRHNSETKIRQRQRERVADEFVVFHQQYPRAQSAVRCWRGSDGGRKLIVRQRPLRKRSIK